MYASATKKRQRLLTGYVHHSQRVYFTHLILFSVAVPAVITKPSLQIRGEYSKHRVTDSCLLIPRRVQLPG
jgi:hypothetical protein